MSRGEYMKPFADTPCDKTELKGMCKSHGSGTGDAKNQEEKTHPDTRCRMEDKAADELLEGIHASDSPSRMHSIRVVVSFDS